jgi:hypothetical protein
VELVLTYLVLVIMASADAYGFWITLTRLIQQNTQLLLFFVGALTVGSVAAAHQLGRLMRSRREGYGGSLGWMLQLGTLWLGLGSTIAWIRTQDSIGNAAAATGALAPQASAGSIDHKALEIAVLLLVVYLLTGALAMTHAYRFGDPRTIEIRRMQRERRTLAAEAARLAYEQRLAEGRLSARREDRQREAGQHGREQELTDVHTSQLRQDANQETAIHQHDPAATDALTDPAPMPYTPDS